MDFSQILLNWYAENRRELPWRGPFDAYTIWVSEVIMQQTRISQGTGYFHRFMERFPDVAALARSDEQDVLEIWKGLGYYSRARNMHHTAREVFTRFGSDLPADYQTLVSLKGIGHYTAGSIASLCAGEAVPAVDGNVIRFVSRYLGLTHPIGSSALLRSVTAFVNQNILQDNPGEFNQAMIEFGALHCTPASPGCRACPFQAQCTAHATQQVGNIPVRVPKKPLPERFFSYLHITPTEDTLYLRRRTGNDIWKNLWDLPCLESDRLLEPAEVQQETGCKRILAISEDHTQLLSHRKIRARFYRLEMPGEPDGEWKETNVDALAALPMPRTTDRYLHRYYRIAGD